MQDYQAMNDRPAETHVTTFLKATLKNAAVNVPKLEVMAREAGLLGEGQRIAMRSRSEWQRVLSAYSRCGTDLERAAVGFGSCRATVRLRHLRRVKPRRLRRLSASQFVPSGAFQLIGSRG
jgi:hypothetical protein